MNLNNSLKHYWELGIITSDLVDVDPNNLQNKYFIPEAILNSDISVLGIDKDCYKKKFLLAPFVAVNKDDLIFCPYWLQVKLNETKLLANQEQLLPIFTKQVIEPYCTNISSPIKIGFLQDLEQQIILNPPDWKEQSFVTLDQQINYSRQLINHLLYKGWEEDLTKEGYNLISNILVIPYIPSYKTNFMLDKINTIRNMPELSQKENVDSTNNNFIYTPDNIELSDQQRKAVLNILDKETKLITIKAGQNTGKSTVIDIAIANLWINKFLDKEPAPRIISFKTNLEGELKSIFNCIGQENKFIQISEKFDDYYIQNNCFLEKCSQFVKIKLSNVKQAQKVLRENIEKKKHIIDYASDLHKNYEILNNEIELEYENIDNLYNYIKKNKEKIAEKQQEISGLKGILKKWLKEIKSVSVITKLLTFIPAVRKNLNNKFYLFFEQYLPDENMEGLSKEQITEKLKRILKKLIENINVVKEKLNLAENYKKQYTELTNKIAIFVDNKLSKPIKIEDLVSYIEKELYHQIFLCILHYYEAEWLKLIGVTDFKNVDYLSASKINFPLIGKCDYLFIEQASLMNTCEGVIYSELAEKMIIIGDEDLKKHFKVMNQIDFNNMKISGLGQDETDYDELEYDRISYKDNFFEFACSLAEDLTANFTFDTCWNISSSLLQARNKLSRFSLSQGTVVNSLSNPTWISNKYDSITIYPVFFERQQEAGSFKNLLEISAIVEWITKNVDRLEQFYGKKIEDSLIIFTCFSAQKKLLRQEILSKTNKKINIVSIFEHQCSEYEMGIFSPVYGSADQGPFVFDEGNSFFYNMLTTITDSFYIFGDPKLFNKNLHCASGIFASCFDNNTYKRQGEVLAIS